MLMRRTEAPEGNYDRYFMMTNMDSDMLRRAEEIFEDYRKKGVVLNGSFSDNEWLMTNQTSRVTLRFYFNEVAFRTNTENWIGCTYRCFCDCVKAYAAFIMGSTGLDSIRNIVREFIKLTEKTEIQLMEEKSDYMIHVTGLMKLLPSGCGTRGRMIEVMEEKLLIQRRDKGKQRILEDFGVYFKFNDAMEDFWTKADDDDKLFFFPLFFWWNLTAILPLRPTEFLLTPRNCLKFENGEYVLTLRRTVQKGGGRAVAYRIDHDYRLVRYSIPKKIAEEIASYQTATEGMKPSELDTLLVQAAHYMRFGRVPCDAATYYSYKNLSTCLRIFQEEFMGLNDGCTKVRPGDTRHIAMISLIISGGSPVICKELAGHENINIASHYYSNISSFVECAAYEMYRKSKGYTAELYERNTPLWADLSKTVEISGGRCNSVEYKNGSIRDCLKVIGPEGELGYCIGCPHYIDGKRGAYLAFSDAVGKKRQVDDDSLYLMRLLETVRHGIGYMEDIQTALLRLQKSCAWYSRCLKNEWGVIEHGKTEKNDN